MVDNLLFVMVRTPAGVCQLRVLSRLLSGSDPTKKTAEYLDAATFQTLAFPPDQRLRGMNRFPNHNQPPCF